MQKNKRTWLITGASSGVGEEFCKQLIELGDNVIAISRNMACFVGQNVLCCSADVTKPDEIENALKDGLDKFGQIDIVVNNAGISRHCTVEEENIEDIKNLFEVNYFGTLNVIKAILPYFRENKKGIIINNTSMNGIGCRPYGCAYVSSKHAIEGLTKVLRHETKSFCKVMCFELGWFKSTNIVKNAKIEKTNIDEYKNLKPCCFKIKNKNSNDLEKAVAQIIKQTYKNKMPARLMLGYDALNVIGYEIVSLLKDYFNSFKYTKKCSSKDNVVFNLTNNTCDYLIVNFWDTLNNYGACLTAFAMQELLKGLGFSTKLLDTGERTCHPNYKGSLGEKFASQFLSKTEKLNFKQANNLTKKIKGVVLGSDQVLRLQYLGENYNKYLLNFVDKNCRKLAISPSFGLDKEDFLANKYSGSRNLQMMKDALQSFDYLSCREISGKEIYKDIFNLQADMVLDPVFLIDKSKYDVIIEKSEKDYSNKIINYILDKKESQSEVFNHLSEKLGLEVVSLDNQKGDASVSDWLKAIKDCELLITDSFHGACFALLFNKPFICLKNRRRGSARFDSLIEIFDIEESFVSTLDEIKDKNFELALNWTRINSTLEAEKNKSLEILRKVLFENYSNNEKHFSKIKRMPLRKRLSLSLKMFLLRLRSILNRNKKNDYEIDEIKHSIEWKLWYIK